MGVISGIMLAAFILNVFLGVAIKEKLHYLYAAYILFILIEILILEGVITSYLSLYLSVEMIDVFTHINPSISLILMTLVMQWFLKQRRDNSRIKAVLDIMCLILLILIAFYIARYFIHYNSHFNNFLQIVLAISVGLQVLLVMASALEKAIQGFKLALLYLIATLFPLVGIIELVLVYCGFNIVPVTRQTRPNHFQLGLVIETIIVFMAIIHRYNLNIKENVRLLIENNEQQQSLIYRIVSAEEAERKRIAQDLHDDVASTLSTLNFHISNLPDNIESKKELENYYKKGLLLSNKAVNDIRDIAHNLLPKDYKSMGLFKTLEDRVEELNKLRKIRFYLVTDGNDDILREEFSIIVYRIINELLSNILKHSIASEASVQIFLEEKTVLVMVEDNGVGFDNNKTTEGIGLKNIKSRIDFLKGEVKIDSGDNGTNIIIQLRL